VEPEEKPEKFYKRLPQLTPKQMTILGVVVVAVVILAIMTGGFIELLKLLVMLFIELVIRIARLIFRF
jgi:hypothetical protein